MSLRQCVEMRMRELKENKQGAMIGFLIMIMVTLLIASALVTQVALNAKNAAANTSVVAVPGGPALVQLWPLLFIVIPIIYIAKKLS